MGLYTKVIILLGALFALYGAVNYAVQREVMLPSFESLEEDLARTDMERVARALEDEAQQLLLFCADWGNWLETYRFMAGEQPEFIEDNMTPATLEAARLDFVAYLDAQARFVWRQGVDPDSRAEIAYEMLEADALAEDHPFRRAIAEGRQEHGVVLTEHGPAMVAVAPVLDGAGDGPHRGAVLLGRVISSDVAARLAERTQVRLDVATLPPGLAIPAGSSQLTSVVRRPQVNEVSRQLPDLHGHPAVQLTIEVPRAVTARGRNAIGFALVSLLSAGLLVLLVLLVSLRNVVLGPLTRMTRHAVAIAEGDDLTQRMNLRRGDELGILGREFDRMVDKLAETRRRLVEQSFEAGAAEVASGLLHNVGNAMTPLAVTVADLRQRLSTAPAAEVELALAELEAGDADEARRADLELLLRLSSRELAQATLRARDDAEAVSCHADSIQRILAHQLHAPAGGPVIETDAVEAVVARGARMVPPALRQRLQLEVDASVHALGTLPLPRVMLQQVVQNLVINAAESVRDSGQERGTLRVSGRLDQAAQGEILLLTFTDDGDGIEPGHLARVFEKGYTTKSRETNDGIGLHWCANAVGAVGGSLRADSPGRGHGACFEIRLPLRRPAAGNVSRAA
jgi:two-component system NtrC family sensor kinase